MKSLWPVKVFLLRFLCKLRTKKQTKNQQKYKAENIFQCFGNNLSTVILILTEFALCLTALIQSISIFSVL